MVLNPVSGDGAILVDVKWDYVPWLWKGGCAMELRIRTARTTRTLILHFGRHRPVQRNGALKP